MRSVLTEWNWNAGCSHPSIDIQPEEPGGVLRDIENLG